jgi:hypothetical protein
VRGSSEVSEGLQGREAARNTATKAAAPTS